MPRNVTITILRTTRAALNAQATANGLIQGEPYLITDESRVAIATGTNTYQTYLKEGEGGTGGSAAPPTVVTRTATSTETQTSGELYVLVPAVTAVVVNLPTAVGNTAVITVKKTGVGGTVTVDPSGTQTIDGGATAILNRQYESITLVSDNANWMIV